MDELEWIPRRIEQLRLQRGVSARDMSLSLGQSESYINKIENGRTLPSLNGLLYICEYFGITPEAFFRKEQVAPERLSALLAELESLSPEACGHLLALIRELKRG